MIDATEPPFDSNLDPRYTQLPDGSPGRPARIPPIADEPPFINAVVAAVIAAALEWDSERYRIERTRSATSNNIASRFVAMGRSDDQTPRRCRRLPGSKRPSST